MPAQTQMFLPLSVVLVLWCLHRRAYKALAGLATAVVVCSLLTEAIDTSAWSQYAQMMRTVDVLNEPLPTVSLLFRVAIDLNAAWLQFVPAAVAALWAVWYFRRQRHWNWTNQGLLVLTVSVMVAPYGFVTDEAVVLPAILFGLYTLEKKRLSLAPYLIVVLPALVEVLAGVGVNTFWYAWTAPAWFGSISTQPARANNCESPTRCPPKGSRKFVRLVFCTSE